MTDNGAFQELQKILGYDFHSKALLDVALTHSSAGREHDYERLEFLGDRVLGLVVAQTLYSKFISESEGDLAKRLAALVQGTLLAEVAREIDLGRFIYFSDAEREAGGRDNDHILADVMEALIGAMYLDGGLPPCEALIQKLWGPRLETVARPPQHPKTELQEWAQSQGLGLPIYKIIRQHGPDHEPIFDVELRVEGYDPLIAQGRSRQTAEKQAAEDFLQKII